MKISMYQASAPRFANALRNLSAILDKAQAHAEAKKIDPAVPAGLRLIADMFPLRARCRSPATPPKARWRGSRGVEIPKHEDTEKTIPELKARIAKTLDFIGSVPAAKIDGSEEREVVLKMRGREMKFDRPAVPDGARLPQLLLPLHDRLQHPARNGVEIGKRDFIGQP